MISNIVVGIFGVIAVAAGVFSWWIDNGNVKDEDRKDSDL